MLGIGTVAVGVAAISIRAYMGHEKALALLNAQLKHTPGVAASATKAFEAQAEALGKLRGFEVDESLAADTTLLRFKLTQQQVQRLLPVIQDYSRATGVDLTTAAQKVGLAVLGNARALKAVGIEYKVTTVHQDAVKARFAALLLSYEKDHKGQTALIDDYKLHQKGLEAVQLAAAKTKDEMSGVGRVTDLLAGKVKGAATAFAGTDAGKIEIMKEQLHQTFVTIGAQLMPVLAKLMGVFSSVLGWFDRLSPATQGWVVKIGLLVGAAALVLPKLISLGASLASLGPAGIAAAGGLAALYVASQQSKAIDAATNRVLALVGGVDALNKLLGYGSAAATLTDANIVGGSKHAAKSIDTTRGSSPRQAGGPVSAFRPVLVGEAGPEMIVPRQPGVVLPHGARPQGGGGASSITIHLQSVAMAPRDIAHALRWAILTDPALAALRAS